MNIVIMMGMIDLHVNGRGLPAIKVSCKEIARIIPECDDHDHVDGNIVAAHNFNPRPLFVIEAAGDVHTYIKVCLFVVVIVVVVAYL